MKKLFVLFFSLTLVLGIAGTASTDVGSWWNVFGIEDSGDSEPVAPSTAPLPSGSEAPSQAPEPATMLLLATGLAGLVGLRKKFKR